MTVSPDEVEVALPLEDGELLLVEIARCRGHRLRAPERIVSVDYSPDGRRLAVGLADRSMALYAR